MRYTIKAGDSLSTIARAHGLSLDALLAANPQRRANPDAIRVGDEVEIPDGATATAPSVPVTPMPPTGGRKELGKLSEEFETGGRGPGTVSTGVGDAGGVSYGSYQMTSKNGGTVLRFVSQPTFPVARRLSQPQLRQPPVHRQVESDRDSGPRGLSCGAACLHQGHTFRCARGEHSRLRPAGRHHPIGRAARRHLVDSRAAWAQYSCYPSGVGGAAEPGGADVDDRGLIQAIYVERGRRDDA